MVVVFGTVCLDRILRVPTLPAQGGYVEIDQELVLLGGEAANTALALTTWGVEVALFPNAMGNGSDARRLMDLVREKGLPLDYLREGSAPTPVCDVFVTPDGDRTMFGHGFKDMDDASDLDGLPLFPGAWFTAEPNMSALSREAVRRANAAGMKVYTMDFVRAEDPIPKGSFWQASTDWAGNRGDVAGNVAFVDDLVRRRECTAILTDGPAGFVVGGPDAPARPYAPFPCPAMLDSTGAGDAFRAGMLYGLESGMAIADCLSFAAAAGSLSCGTLGATTRVPMPAEIHALIADNPHVAQTYE